MSNDFHLDRRQLRRAFERAIPTCEAHDVLDREVQQELLSRLDFYLEQPELVVDVGAGTGQGTALLKKRYPKAQVLALDLSVPMLRQARKHNRWLKPFQRIAADASHLPLPDHGVDVLHANLCFPWIDDLHALFRECARVLKPGGFLVFSMLGPDTLKELRAAWAEHDEQPRVHRFLDMHDVGDILLAGGLFDPVLDLSHYTFTYEQPEGLLRELKGLGQTNAATTRTRALTGRHRYQRMLDAYAKLRMDGRVPATWEVLTAHAWGPQPGRLSRIPLGANPVQFPPAPPRQAR